MLLFGFISSHACLKIPIFPEVSFAISEIVPLAENFRFLFLNFEETLTLLAST